MPTQTPEEKIDYLLCVLQNTESKTNWPKVAKDFGIRNGAVTMRLRYIKEESDAGGGGGNGNNGISRNITPIDNAKNSTARKPRGSKKKSVGVNGPAAEKCRFEPSSEVKEKEEAENDDERYELGKKVELSEDRNENNRFKDAVRIRKTK